MKQSDGLANKTRFRRVFGTRRQGETHPTAGSVLALPPIHPSSASGVHLWLSGVPAGFDPPTLPLLLLGVPTSDAEPALGQWSCLAVAAS